MKLKERITVFTEEYHQGLEKIQNRITETTQYVEDLALNIRYIKAEEIAAAVKKKVLTGDDSQERKLRRSLEKYEIEHQEKTEELIVLKVVLDEYKQDKADEISMLTRLLQEEKRLVSTKAYTKMMAVKKAYVEAILEESEILHVYNQLDIQLQEIEVNAGRRTHVYGNLAIESADSFSDKYRYNNVYLGVTADEVKRLIKRQTPADQLEYLERFSK
ncbi:hypothetical protein L2D08_06960 [Domibacillus sp. PGB-M46]|uniref:hypothetical protein n=1 Tax=Domibacillus sp. PGB-M46 TaxID=2910255 RepID=UPI001F56B9F5|nr:hypothetical protein [Domibacillus sp. PGB-M46]MCI2254101.1 hypothetical protein [Domibacillus sp. PGB-M46]